MLTLDSNSTLTIDQQLHCLTGDIIKEQNATDITICRKLAEIFHLSATFHFTFSEQTAIYDKLLAFKKAQSSQPNSTETNTILLSQLALIVSRSEVGNHPHPLLTYTRERISAEKTLGYKSICEMLHLSQLPHSKDTEVIFTTILSCLVKNKKDQQAMDSKDISIAFFGLRNANFSDPTIQAIVNELIYHTNQNTQNGGWFYAEELADCFFGLRKMPFSEIVENAAQAFLSHVEYLREEQEWFDGRQLSSTTDMVKNIPIENKTASPIISEIIKHIQGNTEHKKWFASAWIESILQNLYGMGHDFELFIALYPHIEHTNKKYPLTLTGIELILSILAHSSDQSLIGKALPSLLEHLEQQYIDKSKEEFTNWLDHVLSPFSQYPTQSEIISAFRQKALAISEPENSKEDSLFDDSNSDSPRTLTTGSDASLTEEETHHDTSPHSIHSDHNIVM